MHEHTHVYLLFLQRLRENETKGIKRVKVKNNVEYQKGPWVEVRFQHIYAGLKWIDFHSGSTAG